MAATVGIRGVGGDNLSRFFKLIRIDAHTGVSAITATTGVLTRNGLLATRCHTLETLARISYVVIDKLDTLTEGILRLHEIHRLSSMNSKRALLLAAPLERHSEHPIAKALLEATSTPVPGS